MLSGFRQLRERIFPQVDSMSEALRWRGPEFFLSSKGLSFFPSGGPSAKQPDQSSELASLRNKVFAISIDVAYVLSREVVLPNIPLRQLANVFRNRAKEFLPVPVADVFCGWMATSPTTSTENTHFMEVYLKRDIVRDALYNVGANPENCQMVFLRDASGRALHVAWDIDGELSGLKAKLRWNTIAKRCLAILGFVLCASVVSEFYQFQNQKQQIADEISRFETKSKSAMSLAKELKANQETSKQLAEKFKTGTEYIKAIETLSLTLDDRVWLSSFSAADGAIVLDGVSDNPERLVPVLSKAAGISNAGLVSPIVTTPEGTQFSIRANLGVTP
jgi:hypothetical protein